MEYLTLEVPSYPYFILCGDAMYRPGDRHRKRTAIGYFDVLFVEYGELYITDGKQSYYLKKNDILVIHPERTHYGHKNCDHKTYFHWLHFGTEEVFAFSDTFSSSYGEKTSISHRQKSKLILPSYQTLTEESFSKLCSILGQLETQHVDKYRQSTTVDSMEDNLLLCQELFLKLLSYLTLNKDNHAANPTAALCMKYLHNHYEQPICLDDLAKLSNCHPTNIIRCFKKEYHTTPAQALIELRLIQAASLLTTTNLTCAEISSRCGFSTLSYFSKTFKKYYSLSPVEYRTKESGVPVST